MNTDTPNATILRETSGTTTSSPKAAIELPDLSAKADTETIGTLEAGLYGMLTENYEMVFEAYYAMRLAVLGDDEEEMEREGEKEKEKEDGPVVAALVGQVAQKNKAKAEMGKEKGATIKVESPILKSMTGTKVTKKTVVRGLKDRIAQKAKAKGGVEKEKGATIKVESPIPEPMAGAGVTKKVAVRGLKDRIAKKAKAKAEMGKGKGATIKVESPILKPMAGTGVTKKAVVRGLKDRIAKKAKAKGGVEKSKSITAAIAADRVTRLSRSGAPSPEALCAPQHRNMGIIGLIQRSAQKEGLSAAAVQVEKEKIVGGLRGKVASKAAIDGKSAILKPRAGAGVMKKAVVGGMRGRIAAGTKGSIGIAKEVENQSITSATTTDKVIDTPRGRTSPEVLHSAQRRSVRIIELAQKSALKERKSAEGALVEGRKIAGDGLSRQIAVAVLIDVKPQILKPRAGAGVSKREDSGKLRGGKKPSVLEKK
ncbi:hypothetical protein B9Z19DRAFT_1120097 [Tuber borchii]|uniref:Uncharacterized protein n=1 Tax=Tuber borchii TaxID=42251 RepID=A0A2T7A517_TUBBO|nr:hypothetical protein B9Z19DRAFT_1120097 [Tuber borchii]